MKKTLKLFAVAVLGLFVSVAMNAQVTTSAISGKISDKQGEVPGVVITAIHTASGTTYHAVSDKYGNFRLSNIKPGGPYTVTVEMLGYRPSSVQNQYTAVGETSVMDFFLEDEAMELDAVVVSADASDSGMNINRSGAGTTVSQRTMGLLPTTSRSMNDVMRLTPQASVTSNGLAVGGGNYRQSYVTVDGAAFNNAFGIGSNLPAGGAPISLDALEQMSINITPFDVRQSGFTGGAINAVTKSGTNEWHVSVYDYYKSNSVQGHKVGDVDLSNTSTLNNTIGLSVGGPIVKDKLFFFVNFEYDMDRTAGSNNVASKGSGHIGDGWTYENAGINCRPTQTFMEEVKSYLAEKYNYNPGRYQDYSLDTPDWKLMARIDWNINENNKFNVRFSKTMNKYSSSPSSSVNPLSPKPYDKDKYGRTSIYAMPFESSRYYQEQNFTSVAAELNSHLSSVVDNTARVTYSHQYEPRSFEGDLFPTVDILENLPDGTKALLTSFGPDPFTYGNLREVSTITATDEITAALGKHNLVGGLQFEWNDTKNGYMQGGAGYYVYDSWDAFKAAGVPSAFAITHANRDDLQQVYPSFKYMQASLYAQDEVTFSNYFKLTYGVRLEMPIMPTIDGNENKEYLSLAANGNTLNGTSTADMPKSRVNVSPRLGFNWDILKNRKLVLRGGTGIYTGRIPFVWIVSAVGNSNCLQAQFIDATGTNSMTPAFHQTIPDILSDLYGGQFKAGNLAAPTATTIMDKNLKMPSTWKSSLALDFELPGGIKGSVEGIYNSDLTSVAVRKLGQKSNGSVNLPGEPESRNLWQSENIKNSQGGTVAPYYITNADKNGYYVSGTFSLKKDFRFGLNLMAAYTRSKSVVIADGLGDQVSSAYNTMTYNVQGSNVDELGNSTFVSPNRFIFNAGYRIPEGKYLATNIGLFYEGYNYCYVGSYSYTSYAYTMNTLDNKNNKVSITGDGGANNLIYIPTASELEQMTFTSPGNKAEYGAFLASDKYLSSHRGEYMKRGAIAAPFYSKFNLRVAQDIMFRTGSRFSSVQVGVDINNVANLLNSNWGCLQQISSDNILSYKNGEYTFTAPTWKKYAKPLSTWQMLLNVKFTF